MNRSRSVMMWRRDDGIKLSRIEVDSLGDRCSTIIQGFSEGCSDDGGKGALGQLGKTALGVTLLKRFVAGKKST